MVTKIERLPVLDLIRGFFVLFMVMFHLSFDLVYFGYMQSTIINSGFVDFFANLVRFGFIFLVGVSSRIIYLNSSSYNEYLLKQLKRFCILVTCALLISVTTYFITDDYIYFGILHLISFTVLFLACLPSKRLLSAFIFINIALAILFEQWKVIVGINIPIASLDFFAVYPWILAALIGYFSFQSLLPIFRKFEFRSTWLEFIGKKSLTIYMLHQPIFIGVILLVNSIVRK
jgi:uncharacterized membrane protein